MQKDKVINTVIKNAGLEDTPKSRLKLEALANEILAYLNREEIDENLYPVMCLVMTESLTGVNDGSIQSLTEGDMSVSFLYNSPFFGKLESFKVIRGIG